MTPETKRWLRKKTLMALRALLWHADEWLHAREVRLREDLSGVPRVLPRSSPPGRVGSNPTPRSTSETFQQWEARKSGVAVVSKKEARRQRTTAAGFDLRFSPR